MKPIGLNDVVKVLQAELSAAPGWQANFSIHQCLNRQVRGVCIDSRQARPGDLFFALPGEHTDGHLYVEEAVARGAVAAVVQREYLHSELARSSAPRTSQPPAGLLLGVASPLEALGYLARWYRQQFPVPLIGITGSTGKTSTKEMIATALKAKFADKILKSEGNLNTEIGVPLTLFQLEEGLQVVVQEMAMRGRGQIAWLAEIAKPQIGVITQIGWTHVEWLGSRRAIAETKAELLERLPPEGVACLPRDSRYYAFLHSRCPCRVISFGRHREADVRLVVAQLLPFKAGSFGARGVVQVDHQRIEIRLPVPGTHQLKNAAAALAVAYALEVPLGAAAEQLQEVCLPTMRMEIHQHPDGWTLLNDAYNANPDSMREALKTLLALGTNPNRRIAVLGDMKELGRYSKRLHAQLGNWISKHPPDLLIGVGSDMLWTAQAAMEGGFPSRRILHLPDSDSAGEWLAQNLQAGDYVLVKGSRVVGLERVVRRLGF